MNPLVQCVYFSWKLLQRGGVWYADGRSNLPNAGRHSLGTKDRNEATRLLPELDRSQAAALGLAPQSEQSTNQTAALGPPSLLPLADGRRLYEEYASRPRVTGGVRPSTAKRYRTVFDKFLAFAQSKRITTWNVVTAEVLNAYAAHLEKKGYAHKSLVNELTVLKQTVRWLIQQSHLVGVNPIELKLRKAESERAHCWRPEEVSAIIAHCRAEPSLQWLGNVVVALACTGLRIAELVSLRWADVDLAARQLTLTNESGRVAQKGKTRRTLKSGRSRTFPIHADLFAVLERLPRRGEYVFRGPRNGRLKPDTVRRVLIREVLTPLADQFPAKPGEKGFADGRLHSFRHYFCSTCANRSVPERIVMQWFGHQDSAMVRHYYHLHDEDARRQMDGLYFVGQAATQGPRSN